MSNLLVQGVVISGQHAETFRKWDSTLTGLLEDQYGQFLGYYPPVYMAKKCFDFLRPYLSELTSESNTKFNGNGHNSHEAESKPPNNVVDNKSQTRDIWNDSISQRYLDSSKQSETIETGLKDTSVKVNDKKKSVFQTFSKYIGSNSKDNGYESAKALSTPKAIVINLAKEEEEDFYSSSSLYPFDGSDIDSDDEDDVEGNYTLSHEFDEEIDERKSISASIRSIKSACDEEQRELQVKLVENYVNDQSKQKYKKKNSLKRIFSKKEKKEK